MNVNDVEFEAPEGDRLILIFEKQKSLMDKYHEIEESQGVGFGLLQGRGFNIDETRSQELAKNFAWRFVEEVTEATVCIDTHHDHFLEELADALHFLTELCILVDVPPEVIVNGIYDKDKHEDFFDSLFYTPDENISANPYFSIQHLGLAMNCLKQKPWKQTHILTDQEKFRIHIRDTYRTFCKYLSCYATVGEMYDYYFRKNKVNQFRQSSNY